VLDRTINEATKNFSDITYPTPYPNLYPNSDGSALFYTLYYTWTYNSITNYQTDYMCYFKETDGTYTRKYFYQNNNSGNVSDYGSDLISDNIFVGYNYTNRLFYTALNYATRTLSPISTITGSYNTTANNFFARYNSIALTLEPQGYINNHNLTTNGLTYANVRFTPPVFDSNYYAIGITCNANGTLVSLLWGYSNYRVVIVYSTAKDTNGYIIGLTPVLQMPSTANSTWYNAFAFTPSLN
jgi:hypothetical protein